MNDPNDPTSAAIMRRVALLPIFDNIEQVVEVIGLVDMYEKRARELRSALKQGLIAYLVEHGSFTWQGKRYYVGTDKSYRMKAPMKEAVEALLTATGGDLDAFCEVLASNALKPGTCKTVLGDEFSRIFATVTKASVETGKPERVVKVVDEKFLPANRDSA